MNCSLKIILIFLQFYGFVSSQRYKTYTSFNNVKICGLFPENSDHLVNAFKSAAQFFNTFSETLKLKPITITVDTTDSFQVQKAVCDMISDNNDGQDNVAAIFGPNSRKTAGVVSSIAKKLQIPHFTAFWQPIDIDNFNGTGSFTRNLFPHSRKYAEALYEIMISLQWKKFAFIYDTDDALIRLQQIFQISTSEEYDMVKQKLRFYRLPRSNEDYKVMLKDISKSSTYQVMIDCSIENTYTLLKESIQVGMMNEYVKYFIVNYDGYMIDMSMLSEITANITTIRLVNPDNINLNEYPVQSGSYISQITTEAALIKDAVKVFSKAFANNATFAREFKMNPTSCYDVNIDPEEEPSTNGKDLLSNIDEISVDGLTEVINFSEDGLRNAFYVEALEFKRNNGDGDSYNKIAKYRYPWPNPKNKVEYLKNFTAGAEQMETSMQNKEFKVIMKELMPFLRIKPDYVPSSNSSDNDQYEGFGVDLMEQIAIKCNIKKYKIIVKKGLGNGKEDPATKQWSGITGMIVNREVDFAITDLTITHSRKSAIDFSAPFYTLGISILYAKPRASKAGLFSFMDPLSAHVWLCTATGFLCVSIAEFLLARIAVNDWENPHPCDDDPEELENMWNMHNCFWLSVGSIMQQGCDILPKGVPPRLAAVVWWFFALIVISSYTANLAAFLTKVNFDKSIGSIEDLANQKEIQYGLVEGGSTESFFRDSNYATYQKMWNFMDKAEPSVFVLDNDEGLARVKRGKYAFFAESANIAYYTHRDCNLTQVGGLLDSKEYGIGMPVNSPYRERVTLAILHLQEEGILRNLTELWWKTKNTNTDIYGMEVDCNKLDEKMKQSQDLGMDEVGGVFLILGVGLVLAIFVGLLEFLWSVRQTAIEERITPIEAFKKELIFAVSVWELRKPIACGSSERSSTYQRSCASEDEKLEEVGLNSISSSKKNAINNLNA